MNAIKYLYNFVKYKQIVVSIKQIFYLFVWMGIRDGFLLEERPFYIVLHQAVLFQQSNG